MLVPCVGLCWSRVLFRVGSVCWFVLVPCVCLCWFRVLVCVGSVCWFVLVPCVGLCLFRVLVGGGGRTPRIPLCMKTGLHTGCRKVVGGPPGPLQQENWVATFRVWICVGSLCWFVLVPCVGSCWFRVLVCVGSVCWFVLIISIISQHFFPCASLLYSSTACAHFYYDPALFCVHYFGLVGVVRQFFGLIGQCSSTFVCAFLLCSSIFLCVFPL